MARRKRSTASKAPKAKAWVPGTFPSICTECFEGVDLVAFRTARIRGDYPIRHACGRVLMAAP